MKIKLPYPDKRLNPNARQHWRKHHDAKKQARLDSAWETISQIPVRARQSFAESGGPITLAVTFHPPDNRLRDTDNAIASCKALFDGIADGLGVDDSRFVPTYQMAEPEKPGRVVVEVMA